MPPPSFSIPARITVSAASRPASQPSARAASAASRAISAAFAAASAARSPFFPPPARRVLVGGAAGRGGPGLADRLVHLPHLAHQIPEPLILGHLPLGLIQLRAGPQVHRHRLAAR